MGILIPRQLTIEQYIKLYSNPVSGLVCEVDAYNRDHRVKYHTKNIRYSKSMILKALNFWFDQLNSYYLRIYKIRKTSLIDISEHIVPHMVDLRNIMNMIEGLPNTFLFSHRHITPIQPSNYSSGMRQQSNLLSKKYDDIFFFQEGSLQPYKPIKTDVGIEFTVFPCEHPYIEKQKISKVGMTEKGNVYILHGVEKKKK